METSELELLREENQRLRQQAAFLEEILNKAPVKLFIDQVDSTDDFNSVHNIWMNERSHNFIGYSREEIDRLGNNFIHEVMFPDDMEDVKTAARCLRSQPDGHIYAAYYRVKPRDKEYKRLSFLYSIYKRKPDGTPLQLLNAATELVYPLIVEKQFDDAQKEIKQLKNQLKIAKITKRELEILKMVTNGATDKEIGQLLFISRRTVQTHRNNLIKKVGVNNTATLVAFAVECGLN